MDEALSLLLDDGIIDEVVGRLKSGKEANIYRVRKDDAVLAAKIYKDRDQRSFKNNVEYKEGRKTRSSRTQRAIDGGGRFGRAAAEEAWKASEATALSLLHAHGLRVPRPVLFYGGVLLMELVIGDDGDAAPRLIDVQLDPTRVRALYLDLRAQMIGMLCCEIIHADLSPYNILAGAHGPTIIDFPQTVSPAHSTRAEFFFQRDFQNVLHHMAASDRSLAAHRTDGDAIWRAYLRRELTPDFEPPPAHAARAPRPARDPRRNDARAPLQDLRRPDERGRPPPPGGGHRRRPRRHS